MRRAALPWLFVAPLVGVLGAQTPSETWRTYGQNSLGWRYSELAQIDTRNVARLAPRWIFQAGVGGFQVTPLVFDGLMFIAGPSSRIVAAWFAR